MRKRRSKNYQRRKGKVTSGLGNGEVVFGCTLTLELRAEGGFNLLTSVCGCVTERMWGSINGWSASRAVGRQFAACLATGFYWAGLELCRGRLRAMSCVCLCSPRGAKTYCTLMVPQCLFILQRKTGFPWFCGARSRRPVWFCCVHWVLALPKPGLRLPMELVVFFPPPTEWSLLVAVCLSDGL